MKKSENVSNILTGGYDRDLTATNLTKFLDPFTLAKLARTNSFLANLARDEKIWEHYVKRDISNSPNFRYIFDEKSQRSRPETYKKIYARIGEVILQIKAYQNSLNRNQPEIKSRRDNMLTKLFYQVVDHGFDKFDIHFPTLFSSIHMNTVLEQQHMPCTTFLHLAVRRRQIHLLKYMLAHGANVNVAEGGLVHAGPNMMIFGWFPNCGETPLMLAAKGASTECLSILIAARAHVNWQSLSYGTTALHQAAKSGHAECVKKLLAAGALTSIIDKTGCRALDVAQNLNCRQLLIEKMQEHGEELTQSSCLMM